MGYTPNPFNYTGTLPNQVQNDLSLANDNFNTLAQAFVNNDPTTGQVKVADKVDGYDASQTPKANTIPVANSSGKLDVGWLPTVGNFNVVEFTSSGTWVVPSEVKKIMVFAIAGGGGGGGGGGTAGSGGAGGTTSIVGSVSGTLISLLGGGGGAPASTLGTGAGVSYSGVAGGILRYYDGTNNYYASGFGAGSPFGGGGKSVASSNNGVSGSGYGSGGSGGCSGSSVGGGGGSGQCVLGGIYSVSPGETLTITIGAGGSGGPGGTGGYAGGNGAPGFVRIIYFA